MYMAGTRNKQTMSDFHKYQSEMNKQSEWNTSTILQTPAFPCSGINVQYTPSMTLSKNAVDIETYLYGIGANNYIYPTSTPPTLLTTLPTVTFAPIPNLYIPKLPPYLQRQRP
jgi:hypothetical protein